MKAVGIGVTGDIEPVSGHTFAEAWGGEQPVDQAFVGAGRAVGDEGIDFLRGRRETGEVEGESADEGGGFGFGGGLEANLLEAGVDEAVDGVRGGAEGGCRRGDRGGRFEGPVFLVLGALLDPAADEGALGVVEGLVGIRRRHDVVGICGGDATPEFAGIGVTGFESDATVLVGGEGAFGGIETETGLAMLGVKAVAGEALVGEEGADVAVELDWGGMDEGGSQDDPGEGRDEEPEE
jgi:hypothetical protein